MKGHPTDGEYRGEPGRLLCTTKRGPFRIATGTPKRFPSITRVTTAFALPRLQESRLWAELSVGLFFSIGRQGIGRGFRVSG